MASIKQQFNAIRQEIRSTPKAGPASPFPPPVSVAKSLYIDRRVRATVALASGVAAITVAEIKGQSSTAPFKVLALSAWVVGGVNAAFTLGDGVWQNDGSPMVYRDIAPPTRLCGVKWNIPDVSSSILNTDTSVVVSVAAQTPLTAGAHLVVDATVRYSI